MAHLSYGCPIAFDDAANDAVVSGGQFCFQRAFSIVVVHVLGVSRRLTVVHEERVILGGDGKLAASSLRMVRGSLGLARSCSGVGWVCTEVVGKSMTV